MVFFDSGNYTDLIELYIKKAGRTISYFNSRHNYRTEDDFYKEKT
jgi:hypothetical protein